MSKKKNIAVFANLLVYKKSIVISNLNHPNRNRNPLTVIQTLILTLTLSEYIPLKRRLLQFLHDSREDGDEVVLLCIQYYYIYSILHCI